tara:strand:- start:1140 stop:1580 length:441 start_codon:yes stop_codon:yes gene_type:complete
MSMININELHRINEKRQKERIATYEKVLQKCHERIKTISKKPVNNTFCFYIVPNIIFGIPIYNVNECIIYLVQALNKNGFYVVYTHPNLIYISWFKRTNSIEYKKNQKEKEDTTINKDVSYKKIDTITPKEDFLYDISTLDFLKKG